jgi:hypothetical protein
MRSKPYDIEWKGLRTDIPEIITPCVVCCSRLGLIETPEDYYHLRNSEEDYPVAKISKKGELLVGLDPHENAVYACASHKGKRW